MCRTLASGAGGEIRDGSSGGGERRKLLFGGAAPTQGPDKNSEWGRRETGFRLGKGDTANTNVKVARSIVVGDDVIGSCFFLSRMVTVGNKASSSQEIFSSRRP